MKNYYKQKKTLWILTKTTNVILHFRIPHIDKRVRKTLPSFKLQLDKLRNKTWDMVDCCTFRPGSVIRTIVLEQQFALPIDICPILLSRFLCYSHCMRQGLLQVCFVQWQCLSLFGDTTWKTPKSSTMWLSFLWPHLFQLFTFRIRSYEIQCLYLIATIDYVLLPSKLSIFFWKYNTL